MASLVPPDRYHELKDKVVALTNARQRYEPGARHRGLSDGEIAAELGVTAAEAREIRCIAELDAAELERYSEADAWKEGRKQGRRPAVADEPEEA